MNLRSVLRRLVFILTKKTILAILALIVIGIPLLYLTILNSNPVAAWFDEKWLYRIPVPITAHTAAETNVYITVTLDTATPITAGKMQSDCGDLRFTKENGEQLPYFINASPGCNNAATTIQVNFDSFPAGAQTIYYYYGNVSAPNGFSSAAFSTEAANYTVGSLGSESQGPGPVGFWGFDEGQGLTAKNASSKGSTLDGTLSGTTKPTWQPEDRCVAGKCLYFDGATSYVSLTGNGLTTLSSGTLSIWFKPKSTFASGNEILISQRNSMGAGNFQIYGTTGNKIVVLVRDNTSWATNFTTAQSVNINRWNHFELVWDGTGKKVYINGILDSNTSSNAQGLFLGTAEAIWLGRLGSGSFTPSYPFNGFMDDVKIYPYARSAAQIKTDYNAGKGNASAHSGAGAVLGSQTQDFLSNGLVGYWKMDESSGDATDSSGNGSTLTNTNTATYTAGKFGNAGAFASASSQYLNIADNTTLSTGDIDFAISGWVYLADKSTFRAAISKQQASGNQRSYRINYNNTTDRFEFSASSDGTSTNQTTVRADDLGSPSTSTWYFIVAWHDSVNNTINVQVNNGAANSASHSGGSFDNTAPFRIGDDADNNYWDGRVDDVRLYKRVLSAEERADLYNWAPGPVGYWDFEEGGSLGVGSTAADRSGNNYAGTWSGTGKHTASGKFGKAGSFNGTDDIVSVDHNSTFNFSGQFSVGAWVYPKAVGSVWRGIVNHRQSVDNLGWELKIHSTTNKFVFYDSSTDQSITGDSAISTNQWYYVMATRDSSNVVRMYVNGVLQADSKTYASMSSTSYPLRFGIENNGGVNVFEGQIDDVKIYNYARTQKQIVSDMNGGGSVGIRSVSANNPVAYWKFDEGQGTVANNSGSAGSTLNGTLTTMASPATATSGWTQAGKFNKGLIFDGSSDYVSIGNNSSIEFNTNDFSVSSWFKTSTRNGRIIGNRNDSQETKFWNLIVSSTTGKIRFEVKDGTNFTASSSTALDDGSWHHAVGVREGRYIRLYINGILQETTDIGTSQDLSNSTDINIGRNYGNYFNGQIDEVKVYNYALTSDEVKTDYNKGSSMVLGVAGNNSSYAAGAANQEYCVPGDTTSCAAPVARWDFEEGKDNICSGGTNDVCDTSGNANNGAWNGTGSHWSSGKIGKAGKFNGSDDYVATGNYNESANQAFSASAWIKLNATQNTTGVFGHKVNGVSGWLFGIGTTNNIPTFYTGTTGVYLDAASAIPVGQWTHIEITYDGTNRNIYVNGQLSAGPSAGSFGANNVPFTIGRFHSNESANHFNGQIDQVRYFNYARSAAQVAYDYNKGAPVGHWKFDECQGSSAKDSSGNNNHGTITIGASGEDTLGTCTTSSTAWGSGATGKRNASLNFDGTDDYVSKTDPGSASVLDPTTTGTISLWFKPGATPTGVTGDGYILLSKGRNWLTIPNGYMLTYIVNTSCTGGYQLRLDIGNGTAYTARNYCTTALSTSQWYHLVGTWTSSSSASYIDGVQKSVAATAPNAPTDNTDPLVIGAGQSGNNSTIDRFFPGQIDDVKIFNYALTAAQVKNEYNGGAVFFGPSTGAP